MLAVTLLESVVGGTRSFWCYTASLSLSPELWFFMRTEPVLHLIRWSGLVLFPKRRGLVHAVRDHAFLPGPAGIWDGEWIALAAAPITADDVGT